MWAVGTLEIYLKQYVQTASGNRVFLKETELGGCYVFQCNACGENGYVPHREFRSSATTIPQRLFDWVKQHRHVCNSFVDPYPPGVFEHPGSCINCSWPYTAHADKKVPKVVTQIVTVPTPTYTPTSPVFKVKEFKGRVFRDTEES